MVEFSLVLLLVYLTGMMLGLIDIPDFRAAPVTPTDTVQATVSRETASQLAAVAEEITQLKTQFRLHLN